MSKDEKIEWLLLSNSVTILILIWIIFYEQFENIVN